MLKKNGDRVILVVYENSFAGTEKLQKLSLRPRRIRRRAERSLRQKRQRKNEYARKRVSLLGFSLPSHDERQRNDFAGAEQGASETQHRKAFQKAHYLFANRRARQKKVAVDGIPVNRAGELLGVLGVVFFSPDEMKLVKESPNERRRFLDVGLSQQQKAYFLALQRYNKTLKQKNNLLKEYKFNPGIDDMLDVWDTGLAKEGAIIIEKRMEYIATLNDAAGKFHSALSSEKETLKLSYESGSKTDGAQNIQDELYKAIVASRQKDKELGYCTVGPHRDDIKIEIDGKDSRKFASQGQQRTIALAMKLGEVVIYKNEIGEPPVLLLDDVLSELDNTRQTLLLEMTQGFQTLLTCTEYTLPNPAKRIRICDGRVVV